ncbi:MULTISPECIES: monovalent cation/H+ antiporter complex subunit F [Spiribacter]|jgi:multicomponent Na+:H+ antiporter subunit F|uniref:pH regulation protein F n=2 Tax=Spiribacter TaxID=1335745 RepID=A0A557RHA4_9GAMM|nr:MULTISPECIES: monovalent cation/H+ antiporter complex subunit F [Spiribacter]PZA00154.1 pH regulation protein F [Gammaproteobacteria bacterium 2W06]AUB78809.1 pH regulation protein F [Spiribacter roseus]KAF0280754.1 pH regulation protein F [Spiribacter roseus]KAF0281219.1 pH regulation protein F [Spiribacter roseus]KAF0284367.1 pH regulation protein F [Spiribacter roseus]
MTNVLLATILAIFTTMALALWRAIRGPSVFDTIVGVNVFGTKTVLLIALIAYFSGNNDLVDVALVYALINFLAVIAVLKLVRQRDLAASREPSDD